MYNISFHMEYKQNIRFTEDHDYTTLHTVERNYNECKLKNLFNVYEFLIYVLII